MTDQYTENTEFYYTGADDYIMLNMSEDRPLANKNLRFALNYAINRTEYNKLVNNDVYDVAQRLVLPNVQAADDQTYGEAYPYTPFPAENDNDKAKEAVYAFLKYYYGEEAAKISYEGSIFPATNYDGIAATDSQYAMNAMITALGNGWKTPKAAPDQTVTPAVQEAMYDAIFGVMQGTYSPKDALKNMDSAAAN